MCSRGVALNYFSLGFFTRSDLTSTTDIAATTSFRTPDTPQSGKSNGRRVINVYLRGAGQGQVTVTYSVISIAPHVVHNIVSVCRISFWAANPLGLPSGFLSLGSNDDFSGSVAGGGSFGEKLLVHKPGTKYVCIGD